LLRKRNVPSLHNMCYETLPAGPGRRKIPENVIHQRRFAAARIDMNDVRAVRMPLVRNPATNLQHPYSLASLLNICHTPPKKFDTFLSFARETSSEPPRCERELRRHVNPAGEIPTAAPPGNHATVPSLPPSQPPRQRHSSRPRHNGDTSTPCLELAAHG